MRRAPFVLLGLLLGSAAFTAPARADDGTADKKWYLGIGGGLGDISGPDWNVQDNYYFAQGYVPTGGYGDMGVGLGANGYGGWRWQDYLDLELGLTAFTSNHSTTYTSGTNITIWSKRVVNFNAIYAAALLRPPDGGHFFYLKLGAHYSDYGTDIVSITGNAPNLPTIAAGDHMPSDAHFRGWGPLVGLGMDFGERPGFIRLEYALYSRIGGTSDHMGHLSVSYHHSF